MTPQPTDGATPVGGSDGPGGAPSGLGVDTPDAPETIWDPANGPGEGIEATRRGSDGSLGWPVATGDQAVGSSFSAAAASSAVSASSVAFASSASAVGAGSAAASGSGSDAVSGSGSTTGSGSATGAAAASGSSATSVSAAAGSGSVAVS